MRNGDLATARAILTQAHSLAPGSEAIEERLDELRTLERDAASGASGAGDVR
jgi:hypothetical protein